MTKCRSCEKRNYNLFKITEKDYESIRKELVIGKPKPTYKIEIDFDLSDFITKVTQVREKINVEFFCKECWERNEELDKKGK